MFKKNDVQKYQLSLRPYIFLKVKQLKEISQLNIMDTYTKVIEDKIELETTFKNFLQGHKCEICRAPLRTNKKHVKYYEKGWIPQYHKKCEKIAALLS